MESILPNISVLDFRDEFGNAVLYDGGEEDLLTIDRFIRSQPEDAIIAFDLSGLEYVGYSYAKPTIRTPLRRQDGEYENRRIILLAEEIGDFLEGVEAALVEEEMAVLVTDNIDDPLSSVEPIGHVRNHLLETFHVVKQIAPATTAEVASELEQSVQNTNNRLRSLGDLGLIRREKVDSPSGGKVWKVRIL